MSDHNSSADTRLLSTAAEPSPYRLEELSYEKINQWTLGFLAFFP